MKGQTAMEYLMTYGWAILIIIVVVAALYAMGVFSIRSPVEQSCYDSGGIVIDSLCCEATGDFPNTCLVGPCTCAPEHSHEVKVCDCGEGKCFNGSMCVLAIANFDECVDAGYPVMESFPRQCKTPDGMTFTEQLTCEFSPTELAEFRKIQTFWVTVGEHICDEQQRFLDFYCADY